MALHISRDIVPDLETANNDKLISEHFTVSFKGYIQDNIPYESTNSSGVKSFGTTNDKEKVVVVDSLLHDIPLQIKSHFYFNPKKNKDIVREAVNKLELTRWNIVDAMINDDINSWILGLNDNHLCKLLSEIEEKNKSNSQDIVNIWKDTYTFSELEKILKIFNEILDGKVKNGQIPPKWDGKAGKRVAEFISSFLL